MACLISRRKRYLWRLLWSFHCDRGRNLHSRHSVCTYSLDTVCTRILQYQPMQVQSLWDTTHNSNHVIWAQNWADISDKSDPFSETDWKQHNTLQKPTSPLPLLFCAYSDGNKILPLPSAWWDWWETAGSLSDPWGFGIWLATKPSKMGTEKQNAHQTARRCF